MIDGGKFDCKWLLNKTFRIKWCPLSASFTELEIAAAESKVTAKSPVDASAAVEAREGSAVADADGFEIEMVSSGEPVYEASDVGLMNVLRSAGPQGVTEIAAAMKVTATAVRQRLVRLLALGDIQRTTQRSGRGRPTHRYSLTQQGRQRAGSNFSDLAMVLWDELRAIDNLEIRRGLLSRLSKRMAGMYLEQINAESGTVGTNSETLEARMKSVARLFRDRKIPFEVRVGKSLSADGTVSSDPQQLPMLEAQACPYPTLAEQDRGICSMEKMMFSELLGTPVKLSSCRLDGDACCTFQPTSVAQVPAATAVDLLKITENQVG